MLNKQSILIRISPTPLNIKELPSPGQSQRCCGRDGFWEERANAHLQLSYKLQAVGGLGTTCSYTPRLDGDPCALIDEGEDSSVVQNDIQRCCIDALIKYIRLLHASPTMAKLRSLRVVFHRQRSVAQS
jgi:hypothetical protein